MTTPTELAEGTTISGRYRLERSLGAGGFGEVWRAWDGDMERAVALKVMRRHVAENETLRKRFQREAKALAKLNHPNVVQVYERGEWEGRPFVVLEFVEGETLREWLEGHRSARTLPPLDEVRRLFVQVCEGVAAAHRVPIVHRDLKPENVLVVVDHETRSSAKVLDFGLAHVGEGQSSVILQVGTYAYMSPEQASGEADEVTAASDVFALGVLLMEMLTLRALPEEGKKTAWERYALSGKAPELVKRLSATRPDAPEGVWSVATRALSAEPSARFADAAEMRRELEARWSASTSRGGDVPTVVPATGALGAVPVGPMLSTVESVAVMPSMALPKEPAPPTTATSRVGDPPRPPERPRWLAPVAGGASLLAVLAVVAKLSLDRPPPTTPERPTRSVTPAVPSDAGVAPPSNAAPTPSPTTCPDGMVLVPAGEVTLGSPDGEGADNEHPQRTVRVEAFCMGRTEVRVRDLRACVSAGGCGAPSPEVSFEGASDDMHRRFDRYCTARPGYAEADEAPVNCVAWEGAAEYCRHHGHRLPTEAEWEYAAEGSAGRRYPWGDDAPAANRLNACGEGECPRGRMFAGSDGFAAPAAVGSFPLGATPGTGLLDMAGNVAEWVSDAYAATYGGSADVGLRVVRGGSWRSAEATGVRGAAREAFPRGDRQVNVGFRCASSPR